MPNAIRQRRGVSLVELLVVVTLLGIFSSVVMARMGRSLLANHGAKQEVRRLSLDLLQMQRRSITSGEHHGLVFTSSGGKITGYQIVEELVPVMGGYTTDVSTAEVDSPRSFSTDVTVTVSHAVMGFNFEGQAGAAYQITLRGPDRGWRLDVTPITGALLISDVSW